MNFLVLHTMGCVPLLNHAHHSESGVAKWVHASYTLHACVAVNRAQSSCKMADVRTKKDGHQSGIQSLVTQLVDKDVADVDCLPFHHTREIVELPEVYNPLTVSSTSQCPRKNGVEVPECWSSSDKCL